MLSRRPMVFSESSYGTHFPILRIFPISCNRLETVALSTPSCSASSFRVCNGFSSNNDFKASVFDSNLICMLQQHSPFVGTHRKYSVEYAVFGGSSYSNYFAMCLIGWHRSLLISLASLPLSYLVCPTISSILVPTLIAITNGSVQACSILSRELSCKHLVAFIKTAISGDSFCRIALLDVMPDTIWESVLMFYAPFC
uniref:Transmembrane protein n=1 Tax=Heterorhabditis bacteriophora TaxID=37862 RepID=A0A1I7WXP3_HETBA